MKIVTLSLAALLAVAAFPALASESHDDAKKLAEAGTIQPLEKILEQARRIHPGQVLETELERKGERYIYEIKLADDRGVVWELKYDARTGELLKDKKEH